MPEDVQALLNMATKDRDALAFWGDSFLNHACSTYLYSAIPAERHNKGCLTLSRQSLVCNEILSSIFKAFIDIPKWHVAQLNEHSVGTIFEALLESARRKNGNDRMQSRLNIMFGALMKEFTIPDEQQVSKYTTQETSVPPPVSFTSDPLWQSYFKNVQQILPPERPLPIVVPLDEHCSNSKIEPTRDHDEAWRLKAFDDFDSELSLRQDVHNEMVHRDETVKVIWRSNSKITYTSYFYRCCGSDSSPFSDSSKQRCPRSAWKNPDSHHPGTLITAKLGQRGGGAGPRGCDTDHIPVCGPVRWTCCYGSGSSEGCRSRSADPQQPSAPKRPREEDSLEATRRTWRERTEHFSSLGF
jgi:DUF2075 family protein